MSTNITAMNSENRLLSPHIHSSKQDSLFQLIKSRITTDNSTQKLSLKKIEVQHLFQKENVEKEILTDPGKKRTRSLNVNSRLKQMDALLRNNNDKLGKDKLTEEEIKSILREYKTQLKLKNGPIKNASTFRDYIKNQPTSNDQTSTLSKLNNLIKILGKEKDYFKKIDEKFVARYSGAEKSVYVFDTMAVAVATRKKDQKVLEKEYKMTVDMRVNGMKKILKAHLHELGLKPHEIKQLLNEYKLSIEDKNSPVKDAESFFKTYCDHHKNLIPGLKPGFEEKIIRIAKEIDEKLSGIDLNRKKYTDETGTTYYKSEAAQEVDLLTFLKSGKLDQLTPEQFKDFLASLEKIDESMDFAKLLHGDIKPDNIFVYRKTNEKGETIGYAVKISDFGKSKLCKFLNFKRHTGNIRFHRGFLNRFKTQKESLNMIRLLVLNSNTQIEQSKLGNDEQEKMGELKKTTQKIADIVSSSIGLYIYYQGNKKSAKTNYFSYVNIPDKGTGKVVARTKIAIVEFFRLNAKTIRKNTRKVILEFLEKSKQENFTFGKTKNELQAQHLEVMRRQYSFELVKKMYKTEMTAEEKRIVERAINECTTNLEKIQSKLKSLSSSVPASPPRLPKGPTPPSKKLPQGAPPPRPAQGAHPPRATQRTPPPRPAAPLPRPARLPQSPPSQ